MESNFSLLDVAAVMKGYRSATRRVIFLDYGGTICTTAKRNSLYYAHSSKVCHEKRRVSQSEMDRGVCVV